ncbi:hypothetical protein MBUL_04502 (plasmid) [Methylobacterium bullatum]|uniref:Helix-turn-helix domain-containing protein n=1 Tax=Methylobacterium bullatum TaxID=570505 RepID=A0A679JDU0_9HYPH|nr:hypothetical protein MBUL_04502 [Methylobacterium bullatum]
MFCDEIRRAIEAAPRSKLPDVAAVMWRAYGAGQIAEAEAEALSALIEARKALPATPAAPRRAVGSRPRTDASMERRRRWAAAGRLPPQVAAQFTLAESAVLAVVTVETVKRGDCRLHIEAIAALAGVSRSTVKAALRRARVLGFLIVTERRASAWRNLSNVVRIVSREWLAWMRLARAGTAQGGGVKSSTSTNTQVLELPPKRPAEALEKLPRGQGRGQVGGLRDSHRAAERAKAMR